MKKIGNKIVAIMISIFFIVSITASLTLTPYANAQTLAPGKTDIQLLAFLNVAPNPIGVGQTATIDMWLNMPPPTADGPYGDRWDGFMVNVTLPNGSTSSLGPFNSDDTGGTAVTYVPTQVGNYTFQMYYPGQILAGANPPPTGNTAANKVFIGDYIEPAKSGVVTLTVQSTPATTYPGNPLPTNYWSRPINALNNNWYSIAGNWLGLGAILFGSTGEYNVTGNYNPYTTAPTTAHILWTQPAAFGGTVGGEIGGSETSNYYSTRQYERMVSPIVIQGILYYEQYPEDSVNPSGWAAINIQTGQSVWTDGPNNSGGGNPAQTALTSAGQVTTLRCGQTLDYVSPNQYGSFAYLWSTGTPAGITSSGTTYNLFSAFTGQYVLSVVGGAAMTLTEDTGGDLIGYFVNTTAGTQIIQGQRVTTASGGALLEEWNSTQCIVVGTNGLAAWEWRPTQNAKIPFSDGIMWATNISTTYDGNALPATPGITFVNSGVLVLDAASTVAADFQTGYVIEAGYSATTGAQLWITNRTETPFTRIIVQSGVLSMCGDGIYVEENLNTYTATGYSMTTGTQVWQTVLPTTSPYDSDLVNGFVANGVLYLAGFGGDIWALNMSNGTIIWHTDTTELTGDSGFNTPYGVWPIWNQGLAGMTIGGGILFLGEGHEYSPPLFRGASQLAINITNGQLVWSILGFDVNDGAALSDGIFETTNSYDNQIYAYGQGPSATTVTAPDVSVTTTAPVTITGTVMDISAGAQQNAVAANFPHGLPCVSDSSMSAFMEAVYMQQPMPTNLTGVQVTISVTDSNHNTYVIGTATTDPYTGTYGLTWTPDVPGNYTVYASFAGTGGYYGSSATAYFYANSPTSTPTATPSPVTGLASTTTLEYSTAAIIIVIIVIGAVLAVLMTRKHL